VKAHELQTFDPELVCVQKSETKISQISLPSEIKEGSVVFIKNKKYLSELLVHIEKTNLSCAVLDTKVWDQSTEEIQSNLKSKVSALFSSSNVPLTMTKISKPFYDEKFAGIQSALDGRQLGNCDIDATAIIAQGVFIGENVTLGANVRLHPGVVISSQVSIGDNTELFPNVTVMPFSKIGKNVRIHSNTTIGSDGFGYVFDKGVHHKIWHMGGVEVHDSVEIGSNCSIDMGAFTPTLIGSGTKIDNQVQIAHNVKIGKGCVLCGQAGVAGSAVLEDYVVLGGRVAVGPDSHLGMGTQCAGGAMINEGAIFPPKSVLGGHPAKDIKEWMRTVAWVRKNALKS
jgi:UDP-3-O-[3-hydroxymyristoyl] glucosamine N-acyltransferase